MHLEQRPWLVGQGARLARQRRFLEEPRASLVALTAALALLTLSSCRPSGSHDAPSAEHDASTAAQPPLTPEHAPPIAGQPPPTPGHAPSSPEHAPPSPEDAASLLFAPPDASVTPPAEDLEADIAARTTAARSLFGPSTRVAREGTAFLAIDAGHSPLFPEARTLLHRALHALLSGPFPSPPDRAVSITLFATTAAYRDFTLSQNHFDPLPDGGTAPLWGYAMKRTSDIVIDLPLGGLPTMTHELVHPLVRHDWPGAPLWIDEGLASLFEAPTFRPDGTMHGVKNWRFDVLRAALDAPTVAPLVTLPALFAQTDDTFNGNGDPAQRGNAWMLLHYAEARYFCQWLDEQAKLWPFVHAWRDAFAADPTGATSFAAVMGQPPAAMTDTWLAWLRRLGPATSAGRAALP